MSKYSEFKKIELRCFSRSLAVLQCSQLSDIETKEVLRLKYEIDTELKLRG